ncbi:MAG: M24 family metallopeptidase [Anaerolineaceae bacterium]
MKSDIPVLMQEHEIDAIWVTGAGYNNPAMVYLTGVMEVGQADLFLLKGKPGVLFHHDMERDGAAKSGYSLRSYGMFPYGPRIKEAEGNTSLAGALRYREMFKETGLTGGRVLVYGQMDAGQGHFALSKLEQFFPDLQFVTDSAHDVLRIARRIKDADEIERIRRMGQVTVDLVGEMADYLTSHRVKDGGLMRGDDEPLTIGHVKRWLRHQLVEREVQEQGTILSIGRDAGVPHNEGNPLSLIRLGQTIILDAFFQEMGGGYFYDFTRTWCLGYAPDEVMQDHEMVKNVHQKVAGAVRAGTSFSAYQKMACGLFQQQDYPTIQESHCTLEGYVHGLGHGIGVEVHELPAADANLPENVLQPGMVITIEPGLYYPDRGYGIRVEDSYEILPDGTARRMAEYPWDLVLPIKET